MFSKTYDSKEYTGPDGLMVILGLFLKESEVGVISKCLLGLPGLVQNNQVQAMANTNWVHICGSEILVKYPSIHKVTLYNDCTCMAYSMNTLENIRVLN